MDLALLVYGISLLGKIEGFFIFLWFMSVIVLMASAIGTASWKFSGSEYSWDLNKDGSVKEKLVQARQLGVKAFKYSFLSTIIFSFILIFIPNEKTAYTMVGAYAAQKVVENDKVQNMSGKVLTIIEQKLDQYIDEGVKDAERKATKALKDGDKK